MATVQERVGILETKVDGINEKIDDIKTDVKQSHEDIKGQLKTMYDASCSQHAELATKIKDLEGFKNKWLYTISGILVAAAWITSHFETIEKIMK